MAEFSNDMRIALFPNDKGDNPNRPDFTGTMEISGTEYRASLWKKVSKGGKAFLSGEISEAQPQNGAQHTTQSEASGGSNMDDEIPF